MADLFTLDEFFAYPGTGGVEPATVELVRELATAEIRREVGEDVFDALVDLTPFKALALAVVQRATTNPGGLRSRQRQVDDYSETDTWAVETLGGGELTESELDRIDRILGRTSGGAFTVRPAYTPGRRFYL